MYGFVPLTQCHAAYAEVIPEPQMPLVGDNDDLREGPVIRDSTADFDEKLDDGCVFVCFPISISLWVCPCLLCAGVYHIPVLPGGSPHGSIASDSDAHGGEDSPPGGRGTPAEPTVGVPDEEDGAAEDGSGEEGSDVSGEEGSGEEDAEFIPGMVLLACSIGLL